MKNHFDDFLGLAHCDFSRARLVLFSGESGSGKSTCMRYLRERSGFAESLLLLSSGQHMNLQGIHDTIVFYDEINFFWQAREVVQLLRQGNQVFAANHLPLLVFAPLRLRWRTRIFRTDRDEAKIVRCLEQAGVAFSMDAVRRYCAQFGATYTDAKIILTHYPGMDFDTALLRFNKFCTLTRCPVANMREDA